MRGKPQPRPELGYYLIVDDKPDGRFRLGLTWKEAEAALLRWKDVGIVKPPYKVEFVMVTYIDWDFHA